MKLLDKYMVCACFIIHSKGLLYARQLRCDAYMPVLTQTKHNPISGDVTWKYIARNTKLKGGRESFISIYDASFKDIIWQLGL